MAESRESTILDVKLDAGKVAQDLQDLITRIAALKAQQKSLNEEIKAGNDVDGKYAEQLLRVKDQLAWTEKQAKGLSATTKLLNADTLTYSDSLNGERQKLADMQKAYDQLDRSQRESEGGKAFLEAIQAQSDAVKGLEEDTGRAQRNVGNYSKSIIDAIPIGGKFGTMLKDVAGGAVASGGGFKAMANAIKLAMTAGLKFLATPIGLVLAAIALAVGALIKSFKEVAKAFKKNDDAMTALTKAFAIFKPIGEAIGAVFNKIAKGLAAVATAASNAVSWIVGKLAPGYKKAADEAQALVQAQDDLEEAERQYTENSARRNRDISALRSEAMDKEKHTAEERKALMAKAIELEKANLEEEKKIKAEQLRILEETARRERDTSDETKNKIAQARADMYNAEQSYYNGVRELQEKMNSFNQEIENEKAKAAEEERKKREDARKKREADAKAAEDAERARQENAREIAQEAEDFAISLIEDETARTIAQRKIQGEREIEELQRRLETEKNLTKESREQLAQLIKDKQTALDSELEQMATDAANAKTEDEIKAEQEKAMRILEYKRELAESGSEEELAIQKQILDAQMAQALENTELEEEEKYLIRETFKKKAEELDKQYHDNLVKQAQDARAAYKESLMATAKSASDAFGAMSDLLGEYSEQSEEAAAAQKAFGIAKIIVDQATSIADTAKAITAAVAGATEAAAAGGIAAPFLIAGYIASMVGAVLGAVASVAGSFVQAKQIIQGADTEKDAGKYAGGGTIPGTSYTGDKLIAHVNSGEGIYTGTQANNLLQEIANNPLRGGASEEMAAAMAAAVAALPAPVVVYKELQEFGQKVSTFNELAKI